MNGYPRESSRVAMHRRLFASDPRRICLIKPSALGDVVQSLPAFAALRNRFPKAHLAWLVAKSYAPLLRPIPQLDEVIEFNRRPLEQGLYPGGKEFLTFIGALRRQKFDCVVDLQGLFRSGFFSLATGAHRRIGLASAREGASWAYTHSIDDRTGSQAAVDRYLKAVASLGAKAPIDRPSRFPLAITRHEKTLAREWLAGLQRPIVAVQPGAQWETKRWPAVRFARTINRVLATGGSAIVLGAPGEEPIAAETANAMVTPIRNFAGKTSLRMLAALLAECDAALTNDSGPMHLAAAVGTPVAAIFTCTSPERAGPYGAGHAIIQTNVECRASYLKTCSRMECLVDLTADRVSLDLARLLVNVRRRAG